VSTASSDQTESAGGPQRPHHAGDISERKARHLEICVDSESYSVETQRSYFSGVRFLHRSLPEIDAASVDTRLQFLGNEIALPLLISCMTGGSAEGNLVNMRLAEAAERARVPVGMGSIRILFRDESYFDQFHMKPHAPNVPILANLSAVQIREIGHPRIIEILKRLEVQALAIHLNAAQELFQPDGDRDFHGLKEAVAHFCEDSPIPVIVKETGFGIRPSEVRFLLDAGAAYVDLAGAGGTNWVRVESYRVPGAQAQVAREFDDWGIPTALILASLRSGALAPGVGYEGRIIASGGLRTGSDVAKAIALGAGLAGMALPFARAVYSGGVEAALEEIAKIDLSLRTAMLLTGSPTLAKLRAQRLIIDPEFQAAADALTAADSDTMANSHV